MTSLRTNLADLLQSLDPRRGATIRAHVARLTMRAIHSRFLRFSRGYGNWRPLSHTYLQRKRRTHPSTANLINVRTGALRDSLAPGRVESGTYRPPANQQVKVTPRQVTITPTLPYTKYVHAQRPLIDTSTRREIARQVTEYIRDQLHGRPTR